MVDYSSPVATARMDAPCQLKFVPASDSSTPSEGRTTGLSAGLSASQLVAACLTLAGFVTNCKVLLRYGWTDDLLTEDKARIRCFIPDSCKNLDDEELNNSFVWVVLEPNKIHSVDDLANVLPLCSLEDGEQQQASKHDSEFKSLPEELVEIIISRISFPEVFKVQVLSKSWFFKFTRLSTFRKLVSSTSSNWKTYCPVYISATGSFVCFDSSSYQWKMMFTLPRIVNSSGSLSACGPLVCFTQLGTPFVYDVLTKRWQRLPKIPHNPTKVPYCFRYGDVQILRLDSDAYQILSMDRDGKSFAYDSRFKSWNSTKSDSKDAEMDYLRQRGMSISVTTVQVGKTLFSLCIHEKGDKLTLRRYLVEDEEWLPAIALELPASDLPLGKQIVNGTILQCRNGIMILTISLPINEHGYVFEDYDDEYGDEYDLAIYRLHLETFQLSNEYWGCFEKDRFDILPGSPSELRFSAEKDFIYVSGQSNSWRNISSPEKKFTYVGGQHGRRCDSHVSDLVTMSYHVVDKTWKELPEIPRYFIDSYPKLDCAQNFSLNPETSWYPRDARCEYNWASFAFQPGLH